SSEALAFIARHLGSDGIALVVATESDGDWVGAEELHLAGLVGPDARALLEASAGEDLTAPVADLIVELCGGNPLALLELPIDLMPQQRRGATEIDQAAGTTAEWAYLRRVAALPGPARQALLIAALADSAERGTVVSALHVLGHDETSL